MPHSRTFRWPAVALLGVIAGILLAQLAGSVDSARAQSTGSGGQAESASKLVVIAGRLSSETYGLYLVDTQNSTIAVYRYVDRTRKLELRSARSYKYDVQLDDYNAGSPTPREVRELVEKTNRL